MQEMYSKLLILGLSQQSNMELKYYNGQRKNFSKWIVRLENLSPYMGDSAYQEVMKEEVW